MKRIFVLVCCILFIFVSCAKDTKSAISGFQYITEQNRNLIGTETIQSNSTLQEYNEHYTLKTNHIIKSIDTEMRLDSAFISEFIVKEENNKYITPEIIGTNGSISVFTKKNGSGWALN